MKLSKEQHEQIVFYLQHLDIDSQELFEEFYDHIASSYEEAIKIDTERSLKEHIWQYLQPEFGGVDGFKNVIKKHKRLIHSQITKRFFSIAFSHFRWPALMLTLAIFLTFWALTKTTHSPILVYAITALGLLIPYIITTKNSIKFKKEIKKLQPGFSSNMRNTAIKEITIFSGVGTYYLWFFYRNFIDKTWFDYYFNQVPILPTLLMGLSFLYALTILQLIKEDFRIKLTLS